MSLAKLTNPDVEIKDVSSTPNVTTPVEDADKKAARAQNDAEKNNNQSESDEFTISRNGVTAQDFTRIDSSVRVFRYFNGLQDVFDEVLNGLRAPTVSYERATTPIVPKNDNSVPVLPRDFNPTRSGKGLQNATFTYHYDTADGWIIQNDGKFRMRWNDSVKNNLLTIAANLRMSQIPDGAKNTRAAPEYSLSDWGAFITTDVDTECKTVRTDVINQWIYNKTETSTDKKFYVINAKDLRNWLNTSLLPMPIPYNSLMLNLAGMSEDEIHACCIFDEKFIVDLSNSVETNSDPANIGLPNKEYTYVQVNRCDRRPWKAIAQTFDPEDLDVSLFVAALPIRYQNISSSTKMYLNSYKNTIQEQVLNYWASGYHGKVITEESDTDHATMVANLACQFRVAQTIMCQKSLMAIGYFGKLIARETIGKMVTSNQARNYCNGAWESNSYYASNLVWIPFEYWIANGAKLTIDNEDIVTSESGEGVNRICVVPPSISSITLDHYDTGTGSNSIGYYIPNSRSASYSTVLSSAYPYSPQTVWRYLSTTNTMTSELDDTLKPQFRQSTRGLNSSYLFRVNLGF